MIYIFKIGSRMIDPFLHTRYREAYSVGTRTCLGILAWI